MKRNILHAIRWALFIPCALAVSLITSIALVSAESMLVEAITSAPVNLVSRGHLLFEILVSMLCVFIYFKVGNKVTPSNHKRLGNATLFMAFIALEIGFILSNISFITQSSGQVMPIELINNMVALIAAIGMFFYEQQNFRNLPHRKRQNFLKRQNH